VNLATLLLLCPIHAHNPFTCALIISTDEPLGAYAVSIDYGSKTSIIQVAGASDFYTFAFANKIVGFQPSLDGPVGYVDVAHVTFNSQARTEIQTHLSEAWNTGDADTLPTPIPTGPDAFATVLVDQAGPVKAAKPKPEK
jgi:hypothetical protein